MTFETKGGEIKGLAGSVLSYTKHRTTNECGVKV